jgi:hypothetical protein
VPWLDRTVKAKGNSVACSVQANFGRHVCCMHAEVHLHTCVYPTTTRTSLFIALVGGVSPLRRAVRRQTLKSLIAISTGGGIFESTPGRQWHSRPPWYASETVPHDPRPGRDGHVPVHCDLRLRRYLGVKPGQRISLWPPSVTCACSDTSDLPSGGEFHGQMRGSPGECRPRSAEQFATLQFF